MNAIVVQPDGRILLGGQFQTLGPLSRDGLARLNGDGSVDYGFNASTDGSGVAALALQPDGRILIVGSFEEVNGVPRLGVARLMPDGSVDTGFVAHADSWVRAVALQPDGKVLIGGEFTTVNGVQRYAVARLHPDGTVDLTFDTGFGLGYGPDSTVTAMLVQDDGNIVIGGTGFVTYDGFPCVGLARLYGDSALAAPTITRAPISQTNLVGSTATSTVTATGTPPLAYQWQKDGTNLSGQTNTSLTLTNVQSGTAGRYRVIVSNTAGSDISDEATLTVLKTGPGSLDFRFNPALVREGASHVIAKQPDGKLLVARERVGTGLPANQLTRLHTDGSLDTNFDSAVETYGYISDMVVLSEGRIMVGGTFTNAGGLPRNGLARLNADGSVDATFNARFGDYPCVRCLARLPDGGLLVAGYFSIPPNSPGVARVVRLLSDGQLDPTFSTNAVAQQQNSSVTDPETGVTYTLTANITALALQSDGKMLVGGGFSDFAGMPRSTIARLNEDGSLDLSFNPGLGAQYQSVHTMALQADGHCLVGGSFTRFNGVNRLGIARLLPDGSLDATFDPRLWSVDVIVVHPDQKILAGGTFPRGIVRLNPNGTADPTFDVGTGAEGEDEHITALLLQDDGQIVIGGTDVDTFDGLPFNGIARLNGDQLAFACRLSTVLCPRTGQPQALLIGPIGARVVIEATSDLRRWTPLMTVTNTVGTVQVCDPTRSASPQRFYRARLVE